MLIPAIGTPGSAKRALRIEYCRSQYCKELELLILNLPDNEAGERLTPLRCVLHRRDNVRSFDPLRPRISISSTRNLIHPHLE